jgi:HEAT repeat protein
VEAALTMELPPERARRSLASALGWLEPAQATPWLREFVRSPLPVRRALGIAGFAVQRQDPGPALAAAVEDVDASVRSRALRAAGELKRRDLRPALRAHLADRDGAAKLWAAWSLVLMGDPSTKRLGGLLLVRMHLPTLIEGE